MTEYDLKNKTVFKVNITVNNTVYGKLFIIGFPSF